MSYLVNRTQRQQTDVIAGYLPNNKIFEAKNDENSNLRKVLLGLALEFTRYRDTINELVQEYFPDETTLFIEDWEKVVGIPDECLPVASTIEERRNNVLLKLAGINATTAQQFTEIAAILGIDIEVTNATDFSAFPFTLPIVLLEDADVPFTIFVTIKGEEPTVVFPFTFPFSFLEPVEALLKCLFEKLIPAHCQLIFRFE
jgi:uncharacterized protein YmfQ (DUF2313 family)